MLRRCDSDTRSAALILCSDRMEVGFLKVRLDRVEVLGYSRDEVPRAQRIGFTNPKSWPNPPRMAEPKGPRSGASSRHRSECRQRGGQRGDSPSFAGKKSKEKHRSFDMSKYSQRQIALRHAPYRAARPTQPSHPARTHANEHKRAVAHWLAGQVRIPGVELPRTRVARPQGTYPSTPVPCGAATRRYRTAVLRYGSSSLPLCG